MHIHWRVWLIWILFESSSSNELILFSTCLSPARPRNSQLTFFLFQILLHHLRFICHKYPTMSWWAAPIQGALDPQRGLFFFHLKQSVVPVLSPSVAWEKQPLQKSLSP